MRHPKLSEAMLDGASKTLPFKGNWFGKNGEACALGCVIRTICPEHTKYEDYSLVRLIAIYPQLDFVYVNEDDIDCPGLWEHLYKEKNLDGKNHCCLRVVITRLNDVFDWSREDIARWIASHPGWDLPVNQEDV